MKRVLILGIALWFIQVRAQSLAEALTPLDTIVAKKDTLREVVVTGQYMPQSVRNSVYRVRSISSEQISLRGSTSIENVLNTELGIRFSNDLTLGEADIELMGMSGQNVKILLDGLPLIDRGATKQSLSQIDINNIARIEIVEGPMSVIYGTDALAGVINIITKNRNNVNSKMNVAARFQEESAGDGYGTIDGAGVHNGNLALDWYGKAWSFGASGTRNDFGGWKGNKTGREWEWLPKEQWMARGNVGYRKGRLDSWYRLDYLNEDIYSPGALNTNNYRATDKDYITDRFSHQLQGSYSFTANTSLNLAASYQDYARRTRTMVNDFRAGTSWPSTEDGTQDTSKFKSGIVRATLQQRFSEQFFMQPGVEINLNSTSGQRILGNPSINDYAFFLSSEWKPIAWINLRPGLRFTKNSVYDAPPVIPSLNTKFNINKSFDLRMAYARGFRAPALRELYFDFFDASHSIRGNENLKAEHSNSFNAYLSWYGIQQKEWNISSTVGGYYNDFRDQITTGYLSGDNSVTTYINIDRYRTVGASFENAVAIKNFTGTIGFLYIGRYNRLSSDEAQVPSMRWTPEVNSNISYRWPKAQLSLSAYYKFTGKLVSYETATDASGTLDIHRAEIAAFHMADISVNKVFWRGISLSGGVRNLFNVVRLSNTSIDTSGAHSTGGAVPMGYGRSYFLGLQYQLTINN
ncbi:TonB-dependent receptor plug domain-containing protein [Olivibacter sitiensis]|uniref:TonB-dependent receptor plug domain-containing protein n=1 Tax=Olivibacter sitiensis TaxID=376470 RepID=UPI0004017AD8|nr:TonB-dependent receptor [Olivibacter sitiensis]